MVPLVVPQEPVSRTQREPWMERVETGVEVPMPTLTPKVMMSLLAPIVIVLPEPWPLMVEFSSKMRFDGAPTSPMTTSEPATPKAIPSEPLVVSTRKSGLAVDEVAMVHAYDWLF